jgi:hypothetical protein
MDAVAMSVELGEKFTSQIAPECPFSFFARIFFDFKFQRYKRPSDEPDAI